MNSTHFNFHINAQNENKNQHIWQQPKTLALV
jgi:hypothetical protein